MKKHCIKFAICAGILMTFLFPASNASNYNINAKSPVITQSMKPIVAKYRAKDYLSALLDLKELIKKEPNNAYANYYLALCYSQLGYKDYAVRYFEQVANLNTNLSLTYYSKKAVACIDGAETPSCLAFGKKKEEQVAEQPEDDDMTKFIKSGKQFHPAALDSITKDRMERKLQEEEYIRRQQGTENPNLSSAIPTQEEIKMAYDVLKRAGLEIGEMNPYNQDLAYNFSDVNNIDLYSIFANNSSDSVLKSLVINQLINGQNNFSGYGI